MDYLSRIQSPINTELSDFNDLFRRSLKFDYGLLATALNHVCERGGKRMRPLLTLLIAKNFDGVTPATQHAAVSLELLHTASLVHDDVVDESDRRRGQKSVNAAYGNKVAVLVGDYILSTALQVGAQAGSESVVKHLADLGKTLSDGEIMQLTNGGSNALSEQKYYEIIGKKTAILFEKCALLGAETGGADKVMVEEARLFGYNLGMIFQIRDDVFDYFESQEIGKPTGNDMREAKLTLPAIHALNTVPDDCMLSIAERVGQGMASDDDIAGLIDFTKRNGGIEYAEQKMREYYSKAMCFVDKYVENKEISRALTAYLNFIIERKY